MVLSFFGIFYNEYKLFLLSEKKQHCLKSFLVLQMELALACTVIPSLQSCSDADTAGEGPQHLLGASLEVLTR